MKKKWLVKTLVLVIVVLLLGIVIVSGLNTNFINDPQPMNRRWLYVGGSGPGNYSTIESAILHAFNGDNIFVYNGTYYESLEIDKTVNLWGEDKNNTIIDGSGNPCTIFIISNWVNISGFTIQNGGYMVWDAGIEIGYSLSSTISGNIITNNPNGIILYGGVYSNITNNIIKNNWLDGIMIQCNSNFIIGNTFSNNNIGIEDYTRDYYNIIYHNNFLNNFEKNARDESINIWNDSYPSGGNYWSDYNGVDNYMGPNQDIPGSDGIGDNPYLIPDGNNKDFYPLMSPWGIDIPIANFTYLVEEGRWVDFNASESYDPDGTIVRYDWDFGDGSVDFDMLYLISHKYCYNGIFNVTLTVTDNDGLKGSLTQSVEITENVPPPCPPSIAGPKSGKPNVDYNYTFVSINPDAEDMYLWIDWGDGTNSSWIGPFFAGEPVTQSHRWTEKGVYIIKAKNKDIYCGHESYWAEFEVTMPRNRIRYGFLFLRFLEQFIGVVFEKNILKMYQNLIN